MKKNARQLKPTSATPCAHTRADTCATLAAMRDPRRWRVLRALLRGPQSCTTLHRIGGASNTPDLVMSLRERGLELPCRRVAGHDRDGRATWRGVYRLSARDRRTVRCAIEHRALTDAQQAALAHVGSLHTRESWREHESFVRDLIIAEGVQR